MDLSSGTPTTPIRINVPVTADQTVYKEFKVSPDGTKCVYLLYDGPTGVDELFFVDLSDVNGFSISDDGDTVVYNADSNVGGRDELFYVDLS